MLGADPTTTTRHQTLNSVGSYYFATLFSQEPPTCEAEVLRFLMDYLDNAKEPPVRAKDTALAFARLMEPYESYIAYGGLALLVGTVVFVASLVGGLGLISYLFHRPDIGVANGPPTWIREAVVGFAGLTFLLPWVYLARVIRWHRRRAVRLFRHGQLLEVPQLAPRRASERRGMNAYPATHVTLALCLHDKTFVGTLRLEGDHMDRIEPTSPCAVLAHPTLDYVVAFPLQGKPVRVDIEEDT